MDKRNLFLYKIQKSSYQKYIICYNIRSRQINKKRKGEIQQMRKENRNNFNWFNDVSNNINNISFNNNILRAK